MVIPVRTDGRIGRYRLVKRLAVGGMADIWLAQEFGPRGYERTAVVKTIREDLVDEDDLIHMLMEEARIAACLRHENIVELYDVGQDSGTHYLAMEFVFGRDFRQIRDRCFELGKRVPFKHTVTILCEVLDALYYAYHEAVYEGRPLRVIHRDVSPQNVIVGFDGTVKLLDFGIAKAAAQLSRTRAGVLKGKYAYMSPEQVDFKDLDQRADVFCAGIVLWESLTGRRLFYRAAEYETVKAVIACEVPFPRAVLQDVPWTLSWIAYRALRRNPRWRYSSAKSMKEALLAWDPRDRQQARQELAAWVGELYAAELSLRERALGRVRSDPSRHRQVQEAGFELVDERKDSLRPPSLAGDRSGTAPEGLGPTAGVRAGLLGMLASTLVTWKWFIAVFGAITFLGITTGVYFGSLEAPGPPPNYAYLNVEARGPGVQVSIGGKTLGAAPLSRVLVIPGRHRIIGSVGEERVVVEVVVKGGTTQTVQIDLPAGGS